MSAIVGVFQTNQAPVAPDGLDPLLSALAHRGPEGARQWRSGPVALGQQNRQVTPESAGEWLPLYDSEARVALVADCRLDNRADLFQALTIPHGERATLSDSRLLLRAYHRWGTQFVERLVGAFAFAIWDERAQQLLCGCDPMGVRPLFTYTDGERFVFASEIKALLEHPAIPVRLNRRKVASMAVPMFVLLDKEKTFFDGVARLPAATTLVVTRDKVHRRTYWRPDPTARLGLSSDDAFEAFRELWLTAVAAQVRASGPVAALLSGGLDSSAVVGAAAHVLRGQNRSLITLSAVLPPGSPATLSDETAFIDEFRDHDNVERVLVSDPWRGPFDDLDRSTWSGDSPQSTSRHYLYTAFAEEAAARRARVLMDGVGGEMGPTSRGEGYYAELFGSGQWWQLARDVRRRAGRTNRPIWRTWLSQVIRPWLEASVGPIFGRRVRFDVAQSRKFPMQTSFVQEVLGGELRDMARMVEQIGRPTRSHREAQVRAIKLVQTTGGGVGFSGSENVSMGFPFLDRRVIEFCLAAPGDLKVQDGYTRYLVRGALGGLLPPAIRWRTTKEPFSPDFHLRYNRQRPETVTHLSEISSNDPVREIVDVDQLARMAAVDMEGSRGSSPADFAAMHLVPKGCKLIAFLRRFREFAR